jgi:hypothetical protein
MLVYDTVPANTKRIHGGLVANTLTPPALVSAPVAPAHNPLCGVPLELFGTGGAVTGGDAGDLVAVYVNYLVLTDPND